MSVLVIGWLQVLAVLALVAAGALALGGPIAAIIADAPGRMARSTAPVERLFARIAGFDPGQEQSPRDYTIALLVFNACGFLFLYGLQRLQSLLPLDPQGFGPVAPDLAFNTAASFLVTADWQNYAGETTMSHLTQMAGLTVQNFLAAATGLCVAFAVARAFVRSRSETIGNFWRDLLRAVFWVLLPLSIVVALVMVAMGIPQTLGGSVAATTLEGARQTIVIGPVASQEAIKFLGNNGGGFFNANSAHPFENPGSWSNILEIVAQAVVPAATVLAFGRAVGQPRQSWALLCVMAVVLVAGLGILYAAEAGGNPLLGALGVDASAGNLEGKELRLGQPLTALFTAVTTGSGTGAAAAMHDSLMPLGGMVALLNMQLGSITPGGTGSGLYGMLLMALLAVFIAGLMIGRTPEYLGKKVEATDVKFILLAALLGPLLSLGFAAVAVMLPEALAARGNAGPHGLTEITYAYASTTANNGSIFAGLSANTPWYNTTLGIALLLGRFGTVVPVLMLAKSLAAKQTVPKSAGTFPTDGPLFIGLLLGVLLIVSLLQYFAVLALGPIAEHLSMLGGKTF